jgi:hypothetical protein
MSLNEEILSIIRCLSTFHLLVAVGFLLIPLAFLPGLTPDFP